MASATDIAVSLTARTAQFRKGMKGARRSVSDFSRVATAASKVVGVLGAAFVGFASINSLKTLVDGQMEAIDTTGKLSDALDISTERLTGFQYAANLSGGSTEKFNSLISEFVKRMGEMRRGTGEAVQGVETLGISLADLSKLGAAEAFLRIADGIRTMDDAQKRAFAADKLFGGQGQELLNFLMLGREGIEALAQESDKLGISFSRLDASTIELARDSIKRMGAALDGVGNVLAIGISPFITDVSKRFIDFATAGEGIANTIRNAIEPVSIFIRDVYDALALVYKIARPTVQVFEDFAKTIAAVVGYSLSTEINLVYEGLRLWLKGFAFMQSLVAGFAAFFKMLISLVVKGAAMMTKALSWVSDLLLDQTSYLPDYISELADELDDLGSGIGDSAYESFKSIGRDVGAEIDALFDGFGKGAKSAVEDIKSAGQEAIIPKSTASRGSARGSNFAQMDLGRIALGQTRTMSVAQKAEDEGTHKRLDRMIEILQQENYAVVG